ncbi:hypothetical protein [uncultured Oscillibacter sp.]|uniref:hypothetical protein n=1 Tax=uncultured Oscillibacter sp. TaxID=876091 RepID=UPI0025D7ED5E|nr:hypothetical protein [uncultured Oscillibacter sp.]
MDKKIKEVIDANKKSILGFLSAGLIVIPLLVNAFMGFPIPTMRTLKSGDWLCFWGGYLGGLIGAAAALIALYATFDQAERYHKDDLENRRLGVIPCMELIFNPYTKPPKDLNTPEWFREDLNGLEWFGGIDRDKGFKIAYTKSEEEYEGFCKQQTPGTVFYISIRNIGLGPATDLTMWLDDFNLILWGLGINSSRKYLLAFKFDNTVIESRAFSITFSDVFGNEYKQQFQMDVSAKECAMRPLSTPSLEKRANPS